ncbi:MAG TPA: hypothetical protein VES79_02265 [Solirubrobacteraceae bacterium]|nr:hypothetical protein [Solirubrobacteraceae bacterium]
MASASFADMLATVTQVQRYSQRRFERAAERGLRMFNLPAASDLDRLARQVGAVERHVRELSHQIDQDGAHARHRAPASPAKGPGDTDG